jgi:hypothetical protein
VNSTVGNAGAPPNEEQDIPLTATGVGATPTPTETATETPTETPTATVTATPTATPTPVPGIEQYEPVLE